jgi:VWFA-related protein
VVSRIALRGVEDDEVARLRSEYLAELDAGNEAPAVLAEEAHRLEVEHRRARRDELLAWVAAQGRTSGRRVLVLLDDNLGLDAEAFYRSRLGDGVAATLASSEPSSLDELAVALASYGWTLMPILTADADSGKRLRYAPDADTPVGFRFTLGKREDQGDGEVDLGFARRRPAEVEAAAQRTGGERVADLALLAEQLDAFAARPVLRFAAAAIEPGAPVRLAVRAGGGGDVLAPDLIATGTPAAVAALRARRAIAGESVEGGLTVRSAIEFDPEAIDDAGSRYEARVDLRELRGRVGSLERASFRVTLAVHVESDEVLVKHELVRDVELDAGDEWLHQGTFRLPADTDGAAVLVELLETGDWGESFAGFVRRRAGADAAAASDAARPGALAPSARMVLLQAPERDVVLGKSRIRAEVDARVRRLVYLLDGKRVATRRGEPWDAVIDLGSDPRQRLLVAIAYGAADVELGRDGLLLNDAARGFAVRIVEPSSGRGVGPVDVEAALEVPPGALLDRVEFYWSDQLMATSRRPPFRQRLFIPVVASPGFVRVAAYLADGRVTEDVVLMNADRFEERVTVNLVELYVVVTDRAGKPVRDLSQEDFAILEEGAPQQIETFSRAGDLPITVGLAIDSSLSLFLKMPDVRTAATEFVDGLIDQRDQAFLVGFGSHPTVVRATTGDLGHVAEGISSLEPTGNTALWEGVVLSMLQLQEIVGRKALVVFYDGDDEDEDFSFTTSLKMAEKVGVPVYLIIMNNALARTGPEGFTTKHRAERLEKIARTGGGKVFYVSTEADLGEIFGAIRDELRSHYLLTYYPDMVPDAAAEDDDELIPRWRPIEVRVKRPGLQARTLAGYEKL